jgi:hypothetical protein
LPIAAFCGAWYIGIPWQITACTALIGRFWFFYQAYAPAGHFLIAFGIVGCEYFANITNTINLKYDYPTTHTVTYGIKELSGYHR